MGGAAKTNIREFVCMANERNTAIEQEIFGKMTSMICKSVD